MLPILPLIIGAAAGAAATQLVRTKAVQQGLKKAGSQIRQAGDTLKQKASDGLDTVRICTHYDMTTPKGNIKRLERLPTGAGAVARCQAVYEEMPGWKENTRGARRWEDLPVNARRYVERLAELSGAPIDIISTGPDREETIVLRHPGRKEG